jgi:cation:H+ antiporter
MEPLLHSLAILAGLILLYLGGNFLVSGAAGIAKKLNISAIVIGLTVVAFGTSAPELFVSSLSALKGFSSISLGNVIGSNIINIALVLGLASLFMPISVSRNLVVRDTPVMFLSYLLLFLSILGLGEAGIMQGFVSRGEGLILFVALIVYIFILYKKGTTKDGSEPEIEVVDVHEVDSVSSDEPWWVLSLKLLGGIAALAVGSEVLVNSASWLAIHVFLVSERFVGITIVAFGTSLPELVTSIVALTKKQTDISVGNIIGSNIFNCLAVIGITALIRPLPVSLETFQFDLLIMLSISLFLYLLFLTRKKIERWAGVVFLLSYVGYFALLLQSSGA